jgi:hypothetical protein
MRHDSVQVRSLIAYRCYDALLRTPWYDVLVHPLPYVLYTEYTGMHPI